MKPWSHCSQSEPTALANDSSTHQLRFRSACQDFIFTDFRAAARKLVEERLWNAHSKVNLTFRPYLAQFRAGDGQEKKVERRKAETLYLKFIKSSQAFYRGFIQRLASNFKDIPEIISTSHSMGLDVTNATFGA